MIYKVLLVDDEPPALEGLKLVVDWRQMGYQICGECDNGEEALNVIERMAPDLVITDIRMPGLDGLDLIKRVRERTINPPQFIIVSGFGEFDYARKALQFGIKHYLLKPVFAEELTEVLREIQPRMSAPSEPTLSWDQVPSSAFAPGPMAQLEGQTNLRDPSSIYNEIAYLNTIVEAFDDLNLERLETTIEMAFTYFAAIQPPPEILKMYVINVIYHSIGLINEMNGVSVDLLGKYNLSQLDEKKTTPQELKRILQCYCAECCAYLKSLKDRDSQINIYKIEEYLRENFKRNLTIKEIAKNFYLHPAYLGHLFLKKFGISFNEYLHKMRIEEAMRMMDAAAMKTYEIAMEVGYNNYHNFLQNFEKYTGVKPAEYKNRALGRAVEARPLDASGQLTVDG